MKSTCLKTLTIALGVITLSCGDVRTPMETTLTPAVDAPRAGTIAFGSRFLSRSKLADLSPTWSGAHYIEADSKNVDASEGDRLRTKFFNYGDKSTVRVKDAQFVVRPYSIGDAEPIWGDRYPITMTVHSGEAVDEILVQFQPSGMSFSPHAQLVMIVYGEINVSDMVAYHIHGTGEVSKPAFSIEPIDDDEIERDDSDEIEESDDLKKWRITVSVPGFSEYTYDDDGNVDTSGVKVEKVLVNTAK